MTRFKQVFSDSKVFYKIYPSEYTNWDDVRVLEDRKVIQIHHVGPRIEEKPDERIFLQFETDGIFYNISQVDLYNTVMKGVVESVIHGQNAIIVAFGQTGSGKSLTIGGLHYFYQDRGLIPRTIENIFSLKEQLPKNLRMDIEISYIEILSMLQAHDLLKPYPAPVNKHNINKYVSKIKVINDLETLQHVFIAEGRKEYTCDTNYPSHIGSCIFTFHFTVRDMNFSTPLRHDSKLHIIDMAGNDSFGDKSSFFKQSKQVGTANCTKSYIEHFMLLLCGNDVELTRVKERTNIISQYLGKTFSRDSLLRFIGHLKVEKEDLFLAISMLRFGKMVKNLEPKGTTVVMKDNELMKVAILQAKLDDLSKENVISEMARNFEPKDMCQERMKQIQRFVEEFVKNQIDQVHLLDLGDIGAIVNIMKNTITACREERDILSRAAECEKSESKTEKSEAKLSIQKSTLLKSKGTSKTTPEITGQSQSNTSQPTSGKDTGKGTHPKKVGSQTKSHKKDSMDPDNKSITKKGKISTSSLNGPKRSSTLGKKKAGGVDSVGSVEKATKKTPTENQQNSSLLSTANLLLPDILPEHKDALKEYILSDKTMYKTALESFKKHDIEAKTIYQNYLRELKTLNTFFEILELRKNELIQSNLVGQFSKKEELDARGNILKSELEQRCNENLKKAELDVSNQQEIVLNIQAEFKMTLGMRQQIKSDVKEEFEEFCRDNFNFPIPNLEDVSETLFENEVPVEEFCENAEMEIMLENFTQEAVYVEIYKNFKNLMITEAKRKTHFLKKSIKWIENTQFIER